MRRRHVAALAAATTISLAGFALADGVFVIDGTADAKYGAPIVVQDTLTGFGDSNLGETGWANGSELDSAYAFLDFDGGYLYLLLAGNLESNFNKLEIFIDTGNGGQNQLLGNNPDVDFNGLNRMGFLDETQPGLKFDEGFFSAFWISLTCGNPDELGVFALYANAAQTLPEGGGQGAYLGTCGDGETIFSALGVNASINNSNVAGVTGSNGGLGSGAGVATGIEVAIPLSLIGYFDQSAPIKVCTFINGGGHDYLSNQALGGMEGAQNLSCGPDNCNYVDPRVIDFSQVPGNQYFSIGGTADTCPADLDDDGGVGGSDITVLLGNWGTSGLGDLNDDGIVDGGDITVVLGDWGPCPD